jgi:tetratricopeptide (TPR) repeat protein
MALFHRSHLRWVALVVTLASSQLCVAGEPEGMSGVVIGGETSTLADGALALEQGRVQEGIRLTEEGLKVNADPVKAAVGESNLCGGYALLRDWVHALPHCNVAIGLDPRNWQSFNNRAAVHSGLGQYDLALADLHTGLTLAPGANLLHQSLAVVEHNQRVLSRRERTFLRS